jgi:hypothetical protein
MRALDPGLLLIGAGDFYERGGINEMYRSRFLASLMVRMGYDAVAVGENELAYDLRAIRDDADAGLPVICANLYQDGARVFPPFVIRESGGSRIGIIALLGEQPPEPGRFDIRDPLPEGERALEELRRIGCDMVILVAHMQREQLGPLVESLDGVDLVIRGHALRGDRASSDCTDTIGHSFRGHGLPVLFAGDNGRAIGRAVLSPVSAGSFALTDTTLVALPQSARQDTAVALLLDDFHREQAQRVREIQVSKFVSRDPASGQLRERYLGMETCGRCHQETADNFLLSPHCRTFKRLTDGEQERNPSCLPCHTTGYLRFSGYEPGAEESGGLNLRGVQCEACHGPGTTHSRDGEYRRRARESCRDCHDARRSPHFSFQTFWEKVGHRAFADSAGAAKAHR